MCESVDNLIDTFRAQVNRVVQKYESQEKPSLEKEYRSLLESIQSLVGYERNHDMSEEKYNKKIQERIENLSEYSTTMALPWKTIQMKRHHGLTRFPLQIQQS